MPRINTEALVVGRFSKIFPQFPVLEKAQLAGASTDGLLGQIYVPVSPEYSELPPSMVEITRVPDGIGGAELR